MAAAWPIGCIVVGSGLLAGAVLGDRMPRLRRRHAAASTDSPVELDEFPTAPMPAVPPRPRPAVVSRLMLRPDELLWHKGARDDDGTITLGLLAAPAGQLGVLMDLDGVATGVRLDLFEVQGLRDALTNHLVATSRPVTR